MRLGYQYNSSSVISVPEKEDLICIEWWMDGHGQLALAGGETRGPDEYTASTAEQAVVANHSRRCTLFATEKVASGTWPLQASPLHTTELAGSPGPGPPCSPCLARPPPPNDGTTHQECNHWQVVKHHSALNKSPLTSHEAHLPEAGRPLFRRFWACSIAPVSSQRADRLWLVGMGLVWLAAGKTTNDWQSWQLAANGRHFQRFYRNLQSFFPRHLINLHFKNNHSTARPSFACPGQCCSDFLGIIFPLSILSPPLSSTTLALLVPSTTFAGTDTMSRDRATAYSPRATG